MSGSNSDNDAGSAGGDDTVLGDATGSYEGATGDSFTETTQQSWFQRIGGALIGALVGLILVPGSGVLLFWNEGRAVQTARSLSEGAGLVISVPAERPDPANQGRLVHVSGPVAIGNPPRDPEMGVAAPPGTLRLLRHVEMYQWREETHNETRTRVGGGQETVTTYRYSRVWQENRIDSGRFRQPEGHANPQPRYPGTAWPAQGVRLGGFEVNDVQVGMVPAREAFAPPTDPGGTRYIGADPNNPRVGDLRVTWRVARPESLTVIGAQAGDGFGRYATRAGDQLLMVEPGQVTTGEMFRSAEVDNIILTWVLRAAGVVLLFAGFCALFNPLAILASVIPPLGWLVGFGTMLLAGVLTLVVAPTIIAIAWLFFRPLVGIAILVVGLGLAFGLSKLRGSRAPVARPA